jgi:hypothetical protein
MGKTMKMRRRRKV